MAGQSPVLSNGVYFSYVLFFVYYRVVRFVKDRNEADFT
jgi:hypothetical protein